MALLHAWKVTAPQRSEPYADDKAPVRFGSLGGMIQLLLLIWAAVLASYPLNDNSFFTHLATGRLILGERHVPSVDPYSFTAAGKPWTVQSWLASVAYAGAERALGDMGLRLLILAVFIAAMALLWCLTRPASSIVLRLALAGGTLGIVSDLWSERPYMIGVIGLSLVWLALDGRVKPILLMPLMWAWVNTHGSFVFAAALIAAVTIGSALDRRAGSDRRWNDVHLRVAGWVAAGTILGAVNPVGPKLLLFPFTALAKGEAFAEMIEWQPPQYQSLAERSFLVLVATVVLLLIRQSSWRLAIPALLFATAGLYAQRNIVMATAVLTAVAAQSLPPFGVLRSNSRIVGGRAVSVSLAVLFLLAAALVAAAPIEGFGGYPVRALAWLPSDNGRVATEMLSGNLLTVMDGSDANVFIDDRIDMYPNEVFEDYLELVGGTPQWQSVLDEYDIEVVVWSASEPLSSILAASEGWTIRYADPSWIVAQRRGPRG